MTPDLPTVLLAKSLDKRLTSHPGWEGFIQVNIVSSLDLRKWKATLVCPGPLRIQGY